MSGGVPADERPALGPALDSLGPGDVLAVARLDRLSRSMLDFARLAQRARDGGWEIVALDLGIDMTTPNGRLVASILVAVAEWEREMIGQRIREGLAQSTKTLGRLPGMPKQGGAVAKAPPDTVLAAVQDLRAAGHSPRSIAETAQRPRPRVPSGEAVASQLRQATASTPRNTLGGHHPVLWRVASAVRAVRDLAGLNMGGVVYEHARLRSDN